MDDADLVWRLGRWIAGRSGGIARLGWRGGEIELEVRAGRIQAVRGADATGIAGLLDVTPTGREELLAEARSLAVTRDVQETRAVGAAKTILQQALREWLLDGSRTLSLSSEPPDETSGATISITHAMVELILADAGSEISRQVLPDLDVLLRRTSSFLELYAPLRLSEEADLIVAKITGQRTAEEIADRSPHGTDEVLRLLASLVATGMLEPVPVASSAGEDDGGDLLVERPAHEETPSRRRLPVGWIAVALLAAAVVVALVFAGVRWMASESPAADAGTSGTWGVAVDLGCAPEELQRVLSTARQNPRELRPVAAPGDTGDPCWRLVWGSFPSRAAAEEAVPTIPDRLIRDGFEPHVVQLPADGDGQTPPSTVE